MILPAFFALASLYVSLMFALGGMLGFVFGKYVAGKEPGQPGKIGSLRFSVGRYIIHLHHWFYVSLGLVIIFVSGVVYFFPIFLLGFVSGFAFQGIYCYNDWYRFVLKKK